MKKQIKKLIKFLPVFSFLALVPIAFAQAACTDGLGVIICKIGGLLGAVLPVIVALGVVYLVYGIVTYFIGDSEEAKKKGRNTIIYGIIGLVVIISVWGLVHILVVTFDLNNGNNAPSNSELQDLLP